MTKPREFLIYAGLGIVLAIALLMLLLVGPRWLSTTAPPAAEETITTAAETRKIRARLFYVNVDGTALTSVEQEVPYGEGTVEQAKRIIEVQLLTPSDTLASAIPQGTKLRALFLTANGEAYLDLTGEIRGNHPGGTTNEILTVYSLVTALTSNLPAVKGVQILIDGKEVDTLVGHLDLRRPIEPDSRWVTQ